MLFVHWHSVFVSFVLMLWKLKYTFRHPIEFELNEIYHLHPMLPSVYGGWWCFGEWESGLNSSFIDCSMSLVAPSPFDIMRTSTFFSVYVYFAVSQPWCIFVCVDDAGWLTGVCIVWKWFHSIVAAHETDMNNWVVKTALGIFLMSQAQRPTTTTNTEWGWELKDMSIGEDRTANAVMTWITK